MNQGHRLGCPQRCRYVFMSTIRHMMSHVFRKGCLQWSCALHTEAKDRIVIGVLGIWQRLAQSGLTHSSFLAQRQKTPTTLRTAGSCGAHRRGLNHGLAQGTRRALLLIMEQLCVAASRSAPLNSMVGCGRACQHCTAEPVRKIRSMQCTTGLMHRQQQLAILSTVSVTAACMFVMAVPLFCDCMPCPSSGYNCAAAK